MKKASKLTSLILAVLLAAGTFTGCGTVLEPVLVAVTTQALIEGAIQAAPGLAVEGALAIGDADAAAKARKAAAAAGRQVTFNEYEGGSWNPFDNALEDRLTRRTSSMAGGTPIDVTPYMFDKDSIAVINDNVEYCKNIIVFGKTDYYTMYVWEFDIAVTYEVNNQPYQADLTAVTFDGSMMFAKSFAKSRVLNIKAVEKYITAKHEVNAKDIKKLKKKITSTRKGIAPIKTHYYAKSVLVQDKEPGYFQFDVDVEYHAEKFRLGQKPKPADFSTFRKVYRSDLQTAAGAAFDVQLAIWDDAKWNSKWKGYTNPPRINFVKVAKYTE